jgi:GT2 family glycosyltransferase
LAAQRRSRAGILSPVIYYRDRPQRVWHLGAQEHQWLPVPVRMGQGALVRAGYAPFRVDYANACGMVVRRQVFETVGLLDPAYYIYFEDVDFCRRARAAGWEIWCVPRARMWHKVSLTMSKQRPAARYAQWWGRARFLRTQPHGRSPMLPLCFLLAKMVGTMVRDLLCGDWQLILPMWQGLEEGYRNRPSRYLEFLQ